MAPLPKVKLRIIPQLPATVISGVGIKIVKENGRYQFDLDLSQIGHLGGVPPDQYDQTFVMVYDALSDSFAMVPWYAPGTAKITIIKTDAGDVNVGANDGLIGIKKVTPEATTINLPAAINKHSPVKIVDLAANAGTYNITIIPADGETINGQAQWVIAGDGGSIVCDPIPDIGYAV